MTRLIIPRIPKNFFKHIQQHIQTSIRIAFNYKILSSLFLCVTWHRILRGNTQPPITMSAQRSASRSASKGRSTSTGPSSSSISKVLQASGMKTVIIGKDKRSVFLPSLPTLSAPIHSRQTAFYRFSDELLCLEDDHTPAEL